VACDRFARNLRRFEGDQRRDGLAVTGDGDERALDRLVDEAGEAGLGVFQADDRHREIQRMWSSVTKISAPALTFNVETRGFRRRFP
jgi:hypothetical protein